MLINLVCDFFNFLLAVRNDPVLISHLEVS